MFFQISVSLLTFYLFVLSVRKQGVEIYSNNCILVYFFLAVLSFFFTSYFFVDLLGYLGFYGPFIITKWSSLSVVVFFTLKPILSDINIVTSALFWLVFTWYNLLFLTCFIFIFRPVWLSLLFNWGIYIIYISYDYRYGWIQVYQFALCFLFIMCLCPF